MMENGQRKLRVLVITDVGSEREKQISELFAHPAMTAHFEKPTFSPSVSSRALRNRYGFLRLANEAGLLPGQEWEAIKEAQASGRYQKLPGTFLQCLKDIPISEDRRGSKSDIKLHYSSELWFKGKTINRGRSVLACTFAHLIALKRFTSEDFDVLLEDNVRAPVESCATKIWEAMKQSQVQYMEMGVECHFRYVGWLGSRTNLEYILDTHTRKRGFPSMSEEENADSMRVIPFPLLQNVDNDIPLESDAIETIESAGPDDEDSDDDKSSWTKHSKPGGNLVWGSYAYWISETAYKRLLGVLRNDVGAMLWRGKRARFYSVKPIDKILPRQIMALCGDESVQLLTRPAFFRAPMLTSKIHVRFDPEFCKSTEYQLARTGMTWDDLWLSEQEKLAVENRKALGTWLGK